MGYIKKMFLQFQIYTYGNDPKQNKNLCNFPLKVESFVTFKQINIIFLRFKIIKLVKS